MANRRGNGNGGDAEATAPQTTSPPPEQDGNAPASQGSEIKARLDRYGEILARGLDLAEAGLSLGLTLIGTVGAAAQQKIFARLADADTPEGTRASPESTPDTGRRSPQEPREAPETQAPVLGITNRLPLFPGAPVRISFSINNDSPVAARRVILLVEAFTGERTRAVLPAGALAVAPGVATIEPMDFEKFLLQGALPPETAPDTYQGSLSVGDDEGVRIPVRLVIDPG